MHACLWHQVRDLRGDRCVSRAMDGTDFWVSLTSDEGCTGQTSNCIPQAHNARHDVMLSTVPRTQADQRCSNMQLPLCETIRQRKTAQRLPLDYRKQCVFGGDTEQSAPIGGPESPR